MTTQYTPILKLALPVTGELSGTWGDTVNDNITSMVEQAVAGLATISTWSGNSKTLTVANGTTSESRCAMLVAQTGSGGSALTGAGEIVCPASSKLYVLKNDSSFAITLKTAAGTGVAVAAGNTAFLFCDGTNVNACVTTIIDGRVTGNLTVDGNATINGNTTLGNATSDTITATARFASDLVPSTDNARDLGSSGNSWKDVYIDGTAYLALVDINGGTIDGVSIGGTTPATIINVDNLRLDSNTLSSTDTNGNVVIAPNGTGDVQLDADTVRVGDSGAAATLTSNGAGALTVTTGGAANLVLSTNSGTDSGTITINNGANANIVLAPNGTGDVQLDADTVRIGDSNTDVTLTSNGTGNLNLSTNGGTNSGTIQIAQGANGNITLTPNGTGSVSVPKLVWSNGTSGRVPYLTTGGQFTDDADMTFDGTTLTVNGLTVSGTPTFSGGTANGVVYLNGSKQATTGTALAFDGNALTLGGTAPRLLSNMSGAQATRFAIQNSTANGNTRIFLYPNGTGTISAINGTNNSDPNAADYQAFDLAVIGTTDVRLSANTTGAATPLPLTFYTGGSERARILSGGSFLIGSSTGLTGGDDLLFVNGSIHAPFGNATVAANSAQGYNQYNLYYGGSPAADRIRNTGYGSRLAFDLSAGWLAYSVSTATTSGGTAGLTERFRVDQSGNFLLGTATARNRLTVQGTVFSTPTLGTASGQAFFGEAAGYGMMLGTSGFGYGWIQQQRVDGTATSYPLILQPVGGAVYVNRTGAQNNGKFEVLADSGGQAIVAQVQSNGNSLFQGFASAGGSAVFQVTGNGDGYLSGVMGVGMSPNLTQLEVRQNTTYAFGINNSGSTRNYSWRIDSTVSDALVLGTRTSSTDLLWLTTGGNLLVGTASNIGRLGVAGEIVRTANGGVDGNFLTVLKYGTTNDLASGTSAANRWVGLDATITAGSAVVNCLRVRAYPGSGGNAAPVNVTDFRGDQSALFYGYVYMSTTASFIRAGTSGQTIVGADSGGFFQQIGGNYYLVTTSGGSTSDATLKTNVQQLSGALGKVCAMRGVNFEFIDEPMCTADKGAQLGVIAQEVEAQYPEIVLTDDKGKKTVRYDRLVAPLIEAIKELKAEFDAYKATHP